MALQFWPLARPAQRQQAKAKGEDGVSEDRNFCHLGIYTVADVVELVDTQDLKS